MPDEQLPRVRAPWTTDQVESLNAYQGCGWFHAFTCPREHSCPDPRCGDSTWDHECELAGKERLVAAPDGWVCPACSYRQGWAYLFMADGSWRQQAQTIETALAELRDDPSPEEIERRTAEFHELTARVDADPGERARIERITAELDNPEDPRG